MTGQDCCVPSELAGAGRANALAVEHEATASEVGEVKLQRSERGNGELACKSETHVLSSLKVCSYQVHAIVPTRIKTSAQAGVAWL